MQYVGFWPRVGAAIIDSIVLVIGSFIISFVLALIVGVDSEGGPGIANLLGFLVGLLYEPYFISSKHQATPGKMAIGAIVVKPDGSPVSFLNGIGRVLGKYLSGLILLIGYIMVAFTEKKQGLHDMVANTVVVKKAAVIS
jgi:uncharacterized RDD family membrane protein YckC